MPRRLLILISVSLCMSVIDSKLSSFLSNASTIRPRFPMLLPRHTPWPTVQDETSFRQLALGLGLIHETYDVTTADGYVLNLNRVVNPNLVHHKTKGVPILMVNGLMMHSEAWLIQGNPRDNMAVTLLEAGYDLWMGDQRGTLRSRRHVTYNYHQTAFWDFTYHEVGVYDLPAFIDYVLSATGYPKLVYTGLSLGGTFYFVMCSERPEYQSKIFGSVQLVPVAVVPRVFQMPPRTQMTITTVETMMWMYNFMGAKYIRELPLIRKNIVNWCRVTVDLWMLSFAFTIGPGGHYRREDFCHQVALPFGGTSVTTVLHTIQMYKTGKFRQYDRGLIGNILKYGAPEPPSYDLKRVSVPTAVYYSDIDVFVPAKYAERLMDQLSGPIYGCIMKGLTHVSAGLDSRFKYYLQDIVDVIDSMTGLSNSTKAFSGQSCYPDLSMQ